MKPESLRRPRREGPLTERMEWTERRELPGLGTVLGIELKTGQSHKAAARVLLNDDNEAQMRVSEFPNDNVQLAVPTESLCPTPSTFKLGNTDGFLGLYK
jgi:hypothetical protein